jgi:hypothetical protein
LREKCKTEFSIPSFARLHGGEGEVAIVQDGLGDNTAKGQHGKTSVGDFLELHCVDFCLRLVLHETHGIESKVTRFASGSVQHLSHSDGVDDLGEAEPHEKLLHGPLLDEGIVGSEGGEAFVALGEGVDPDPHVHSDKADRRHHADAPVLDLGLTEEIHGNKIGESERIKSNAANNTNEIGGMLQKREGGAGNVRLVGSLKELRRSGATWRRGARSRIIGTKKGVGRGK